MLAYCDQPLVSIDFNHDPASSTYDSKLTRVIDGRLVKVVAWYDNEWGFSNRMLDTTVALDERGLNTGIFQTQHIGSWCKSESNPKE